MRHRPLALATLALVLGGAPAAAQEAQTPTPPTEAASFSDTQLEAFVDVAVDVQSVIAEARPRIAAADSEEAGRAVVEETNARIMALIEQHPDITFEEYRNIAMHTEQDAAFKSRVDGMVREAMEQGTTPAPEASSPGQGEGR